MDENSQFTPDQLRNAANLRKLLDATMKFMNSWTDWRLGHPIERDGCKHSKDLLTSYDGLEIALINFIIENPQIQKTMNPATISSAVALKSLHDSGAVKLSNVLGELAGKIEEKEHHNQEHGNQEHRDQGHQQPASKIGLFIKK